MAEGVALLPRSRRLHCPLDLPSDCGPDVFADGLFDRRLAGFLLPVFTFNTVFGATLFFQHNHPMVPWFRGPIDRETFARPEYLTTHLTMPRWMSKFMHGIFDHAVHHVNPRIPLYRAFEAQVYLNHRLKGAPLVIEKFSLDHMLRTMRTCKLYDFERHCWTDFGGRPTTGTIPLVARMADSTEAVVRF